MAYVAITNDLINRVESKIKTMKNHEIETSCPGLNETVRVDASQLYNMGCWGAENVHLINVIPHDWIQEITEANIVVKGTVDIEGDPVPVQLRKDVRFSGLTNAFQRPNASYYSRSNSELDYNDLVAMPDHIVGRNELVARFELARTEAQIKARWEKINKDITAFLRSCKSLNEAIKLLPGVKMYVDRDDIERVERKVQRAPREELVKEVDAGAITAAAIAARLSGALV